MFNNSLYMKKVCFILFINLVYLHAYAQLNNNGAAIKLTTGAYIVLQDINFKNNGTFLQSAGTVKMTGNNNNYIFGSVKPQFFNLQIAKSETKQVLLLTDFNVTGEILFSSGLLHLNKKNIFLLGTAVLKGEADSRRIIGPAGGYIEVKALLNAPVNVNPGNLGALISSTQNLGNTTIRRRHQSQKIGGGNSNSIFRYYEIIPANTAALNAALRFNYFDGELNGLNENNLILFKKVNTAPWSNQGFTKRSITANYVIKTAISDLFLWTLSAPNVGLRGIDTNNEQNTYSTDNISKNAHSLFIENVYPTIGSMQNIYIKTGNMDLENVQVMLYDMKGKLILNQQINYQSQWITLPQLLPAGIYKLVIQSGESNYQQSFMKQ